MAALRTTEPTKSTQQRYRALVAKRVRPRSEVAGEPHGRELLPTGATALAWIDGSEWSIRALLHLLQQPLDRVILLYVAPRAAAGYVECGWMVLEAAMHRCRLQEDAPPIECRREVGDTANRILAVCREERPDIVVMSATARSDLPSLAGTEEFARALWPACACRVLVASPRGMELFAGDKRKLLAWRLAQRLPGVAAESSDQVERDAARVQGLPQQSAVAAGGVRPSREGVAGGGRSKQRGAASSAPTGGGSL